jgi:uncharacterized protein
MKRAFLPGHPLSDLIVVTAICFGWFISQSVQAVWFNWPETPYDDAALLRLVVVELGLASLALAYLWSRDYPLGELLPRPSLRGSAAGVLIYLISLPVGWALLLIVTALAPASAPPEATPAAISWPPLILMSVVNGIYEEIALIGVLQRGLEKYGSTIAVGVPLLVRGLFHLYQSAAGVVMLLGFGLVLGLAFCRRRRREDHRRALWSVAFAHVLADLVGFAQG